MAPRFSIWWSVEGVGDLAADKVRGLRVEVKSLFLYKRKETREIAYNIERRYDVMHENDEMRWLARERNGAECCLVNYLRLGPTQE